MKRTFAALLALVCVCGSSWAADYEIDPSHSSIGFKVKHLAISSVPGKFAQFAGSFSFDPAKVEAASAEASITATSIDTGDKKRDDHLRSGEFLDTAAHPAITFKTTKVEKLSSTEFKAHGELSIHGVPQPVTLNVVFGGAVKDPWGKERAAFVATTRINRRDFGLTWSKVLETGGLVVGDDVEVTLEVEGVKKA